MGFFSNLVSDPIGTIGSAGQKLIDNPIPAITAYATGNPTALLAYGAPTPSAANASAYGNVLQGGLGTYGNLMQRQVSKEAIQAAQEEARRAGQQASTMAGFRPVGITTRFGASQFQVDPTTGQLTSAGYTTSPELQAAQERLMGLGAGYLAKTPEEVAQKFLASQMDLLAPSRERQYAQLQNQLYQQGRGGLSVGATGTRPSGAAGLGATTPETEAYYNALAQQDAQLAAQAQQAGQQNVAFGTGLLGTGANLMGQYQAGQVGALNPFTTYLGGGQAIEQMGQQPLTLGAGLGGQQAAYGANAGRNLLTGGLSAAVTQQAANAYNPVASILSGIGQNPQFGQGIANWWQNLPTSNFGSWSGGGVNTSNAGYTPSVWNY